VDERKQEIKSAIIWSKRVFDEHSDAQAGYEAMNDLIYYSWEERNLWRDPTQWSLSAEKFRDLGRMLDNTIKSSKKSSYRIQDTLVRFHDMLGNNSDAVAAAQKVCQLLENAALRRSNNTAGFSEIRYGFRWMAQVMSHLRDEDERDSLAFALDVIQGRT
jgi:hypothetical protein